MISQTAQYALRALVCLAIHKDGSLTVGQLASMTRVSPEYLSKVMQALVRADLVTSKPGKTGGFSLRVPPERLSMLSVVEAIDPPSSEESYPLDFQSYGSILQPLHQKLIQLSTLVRRECGKIMITDLLP
jgi:Rrf2 family transcriptional regulator, nitric oxide-sensitive transcriptional repressor